MGDVLDALCASECLRPVKGFRAVFLDSPYGMSSGGEGRSRTSLYGLLALLLLLDATEKIALNVFLVIFEKIYVLYT